MVNTSLACGSVGDAVEQPSHLLLCGCQLPFRPVKLVLQPLQLGPDISLWGRGVRVAHIRAAVRANIHQAVRLEQAQSSADSVSGCAVHLLKLAMGRELCARGVLSSLNVRPDQRRQALAIDTYGISDHHHRAILPSWLTPKLLTSGLPRVYCRKPVNWHKPVSTTACVI